MRSFNPLTPSADATNQVLAPLPAAQAMAVAAAIERDGDVGEVCDVTSFDVHRV